MTYEITVRRHRLFRTVAGIGSVVALALWLVVPALAQIDICGCSGNSNSLGAFSTLNAATFPPGTVAVTNHITLPLPPDGVMVLDSMLIQSRPGESQLVVDFKPNAANTPVTLLVKGDLTISTTGASSWTLSPHNGNYPILSVSGQTGVTPTADVVGAGGLGGPGGFRGGDGAYQRVNLATNGGAGLGPGGGAGSTAVPFIQALDGVFMGVPELLPLLGGSGGGGGESSSSTLNACAGGGGGGGGGAILIAVNGTATINGAILAEGGNGINSANAQCSSFGGAGSGGAVRVLAGRIIGPGNGSFAGIILARSGTTQGTSTRPVASVGSVRMESQNNEFPVTRTDPTATRALFPGPLANPLMPTVTITHVAGLPVPPPPQGVFGKVDVNVPMPGNIGIDLTTSGVPSGTGVLVTAKPRVGPTPTSTTIVLTNCDATGACLATAPLTLAAGAYTIEARATFATP